MLTSLTLATAPPESIHTDWIGRFVNRLNSAAAGTYDTSLFSAADHYSVAKAAGPLLMDKCVQMCLHNGAFALDSFAATCTITIASPAVVTVTGLCLNMAVKFSTTVALPTGIVAGTTYYVAGTVTAGHFNIAATPGGTPINTSGTQSGVHTVTKVAVAAGPEISQWLSADPAKNDLLSITAAQGTYFNYGFPLKPIRTSSGMLTTYDTGFAALMNPFALGNRWMHFFVLTVPAVDATFSTKATMDADLSWPHGSVAQVISDGTVANNKYWIKNGSSGTVGTSWLTFDLNPMIRAANVTSATGGTQKYHLYLYGANPNSKQIGNLSPYLLLNASPLVQMQSWATEELPGAGQKLIAVACDGQRLHVYFDGLEKCGNFNTSVDTYPFAAVRFVLGELSRATYDASVMFNDYDQSKFRAIHDSIANMHSLPTLQTHATVAGFGMYGQSWATGSYDTTADGWNDPSGWNGMVTGTFTHYPSRDAVPPGWWAGNPLIPPQVGPSQFNVQESTGSAVTQQQPILTGGSEGVCFGIMKQISARNPAYDMAFCHGGAGGASVAILTKGASGTTYATPALLLAAADAGTIPATGYYEQYLATIACTNRLARADGKAFIMKAMFWLQGGSDASNANFETDLVAWYDTFNADVKAITGQTADVAFIMEQCANSPNGTAISSVAKRYVKILAVRGSRPIMLYGSYFPVTNHIHLYARGYRWSGEQMAKFWGRYEDGLVESTTFTEPVRPSAMTRVSNTVVIDYYAPVGPLQFATNNNNIASSLANKGFEFTSVASSGLTISSVTLTGAKQVTVTLSGTPLATDLMGYCCTNQRYGNLCDSDASTMYYHDQDWTTGVWPAPVEAEGLLNDPKNWAVSFQTALT